MIVAVAVYVCLIYCGLYLLNASKQFYKRRWKPGSKAWMRLDFFFNVLYFCINLVSVLGHVVSVQLYTIDIDSTSTKLSTSSPPQKKNELANDSLNVNGNGSLAALPRDVNAHSLHAGLAGVVGDTIHR